MANLLATAARVFKLLGEETKLTILYHLSQGELSVSEIVERTGLEQSNISHQLRTLKENHLVQSRRQGRQQIYRLDDQHVFSVIEQLIEHIQHTEHFQS